MKTHARVAIEHENVTHANITSKPRRFFVNLKE